MDIDIDFADREKILALIKHIPASKVVDSDIKKHNTGIYVQDIPVSPFTGSSSIDYKSAEERGYIKLDFLNVSAYKNIKSKDHIKKLLNAKPHWELLHEKDICDQLVHINGYHGLLSKLNPTNMLELATVLALIRPGKKHLITKCVDHGFESIQDEIWEKTEDSYSFKKSHAVSYAHLVIMQLNLLCEEYT
jgi:DNA polymerase III alpha subunit